jgi:hypothetical protein
MSPYHLLTTTAEQKQIGKHIHDLDRWVARERDPQIARILRNEIEQLHLEWNHLREKIEAESRE